MHDIRTPAPRLPATQPSDDRSSERTLGSLEPLVARRPGLRDLRADGYGFQAEAPFQAGCSAARSVEVPILLVERRSAESKLSYQGFLESALPPWRLPARRVVERLRAPE